MTVPARLHVLLAARAPQAIVIRRGPSERVAAIGWNRDDDSFRVGQWLKGRLYPFRSDIAPDGRHWIYFAMSRTGTWTAVAKTPYLKALDFYPKDDAWNGGGLFLSNNEYWLNDGPYRHQRERLDSRLVVAATWHGEENWQGECPGIYFRRLKRDGWYGEPKQNIEKRHSVYPFRKRINRHWTLVQVFQVQWKPPVGRGLYHSTYALCSEEERAWVAFDDWEWADVDKGRLVWASGGCLWAGVVTREGLEKETLLLDTNPMTFTELTAPY